MKHIYIEARWAAWAAPQVESNFSLSSISTSLGIGFGIQRKRKRWDREPSLFFYTFERNDGELQKR
jgi:hypothetical protein